MMNDKVIIRTFSVNKERQIGKFIYGNELKKAKFKLPLVFEGELKFTFSKEKNHIEIIDGLIEALKELKKEINNEQFIDTLPFSE